MRRSPVLIVLALVLPAGAVAQEATAPLVVDDFGRVRTCIPAQEVVPPFNNTMEAMEQARIAASLIVADVCEGSPLNMELPVTNEVAEPASTSAI